MPPCLFERLHDLEDLKVCNPECIRIWSEYYPEYEKLTRISPEERAVELTKYQKQAIKIYSGFAVVKEAIDGKRSIRDSFLELRKINLGIHKYLPRKKDSEHNERVGEMGKVIGNDNILGFLKKGYHFPDNFVTTSAEMQAALLIPALLGYTLPIDYLGKAAIFSLGFGAFVSKIIRSEKYSDLEICSDGEARAIYVDKKIQELLK